jgi:hypothetical protein
MAQWLICPFWVSEHRTLEDEHGSIYQADYQVIEVRVTNPGDAEGRLDLVFYEARGDGRFFTYGGFEIWMSLDEMVVDIAVSKVTRNTAAGLENTSQRTLLLVPKRMPLRYMLSELFGRPQSPFTFPGGTVSGAGNGSITPWRP